MANAPLPSPLPASRGEGEPGTAAATTITLPDSNSNSASTSALTSNPFPSASSSSSSSGPVAAGLLLAALAAATLVLARRRRAAPRLVRILESASLGPKRSLVVARLGDEILVLGSSEGGITLLATRPAPAEDLAVAPLPSTHLAAQQRARESKAPSARAAWGKPALPAALRGFFARLRPGEAPRASAARGFERVLTESLEDVELRRKLAAGHAGSVR